MFLYFINNAISKQWEKLILDNFKKIKIQNTMSYFIKNNTDFSICHDYSLKPGAAIP